MTTTPKAQKDKFHTSVPRLAPRPTAASTARAARNRNLLTTQAQRQSPTRPPTSGSPVPSKPKCSTIRNPPKIESKNDVKVPVRPELDTYIVEKVSVVILEEPNSDKILCENIEELDGLNETDEKCEEDTITEFDNVNSDQVPEQLSLSRPSTPAKNSRPQTPRSVQSSRPQTPCPQSRPTTPCLQSCPTTPVHPRHATPVSRPNTPQRLTPTSPLNVEKSENTPSPKSVASPQRSPATKEDGDIKSIYTLKQKQFHIMKKELDLKQQAVLEVFDCLRGLRERMNQEGLSGHGEGLPQQELVIFNVADWAADEVAQLCRDAAACASSDGAADFMVNLTPIDECALEEIDAKAATVPARFADLCLQAFTARQELVDWVKKLLEKDPETESEGVERIECYNTQGLQLCHMLRELKTYAETIVENVTQVSRRACRERSALAKVGETLVRETALLRQEVEASVAALNEMRSVQSDGDTIRLLEETRRELDEEKAARLVTKDKLSTTEAQLRQTRARVSKMDRQLREAEASIASLTGTVKALEDQSRQREVQLEARARKLRESLKTGEVASGHIAQQRDALQVEVAELKEFIENMTAQHKSLVQDLTNQLKDAKTVLAEQKRMTQHEIEQKESLQKSLVESQNTIELLKEKITELENSRPNPELPTEREMDLRVELQATKDTLRIAEEELAASKKEKVRFLETMTKITESDNKMSMQQKLAAELLSKEEIVGKLQTEIREMTKNIKLNEQKVAQYEQYVRSLQAHNRVVANCQEAPNGISYQDLQQEIMSLKMSLLDAEHQKDKLNELLMQKEQQLEQQEKTSRTQARVIKVREELINMLKNKEIEQSSELSALQQDLEHRMTIVSDVNQQIAAKAEEIQELFKTLESKQKQIHRLEKIVLALEEQQRRAQVQRTRHEEKIAELEHELAACGNRRERKYLFF